MEQYRALVAAMKILERLRLEVFRDEGCMSTPAWDKLYNAGYYLKKQANQVVAEPA